MEAFRNLEELPMWLKANGVDVSLWGKGGAKSLENLWDEYVNGEVSFETNPPRRLVEVVQMIIGRENKILVEAAQEFVNGQYRERHRPPSEKIKPGENFNDAARRCLREELDLQDSQISFNASEVEKEVKIIDSPSYPGLLTQYTLYKIKLTVDDLPQAAFWTENEAAQSGDPVRRHLWDWVGGD